MRRSGYVIDTDRLSQVERAEVCQQVLGALQVIVTRFETDVPWVEHEKWPGSVRAAADRLVVASGEIVDPESYQATGVLVRADDDVWAAFCSFAGYAYDASAWSSSSGRPVVSFSDAGAAVVIDVEEVDLRSVELAVHPVRVVPLEKVRPWWSRRRT